MRFVRTEVRRAARAWFRSSLIAAVTCAVAAAPVAALGGPERDSDAQRRAERAATARMSEAGGGIARREAERQRQQLASEAEQRVRERGGAATSRLDQRWDKARAEADSAVDPSRVVSMRLLAAVLGGVGFVFAVRRQMNRAVRGRRRRRSSAS